MKKLIIIEGLDNTGKTTLINRICNILKQCKKTYTVIKADNPVKNIKDLTAEQIEEKTDEYYSLFMKNIRENTHYYDYIILDRSWISEFVYGYIYRNQDRLHIIEKNIMYERELYTLFYGNVFLYVLFASSNFLQKNEDGNSLSHVDRELINKELYLFNSAYEYSIIPLKKRYQINLDLGNNEYDFLDVLPDVINDILPLDGK